jgi:hypothetical protein
MAKGCIPPMKPKSSVQQKILLSLPSKRGFCGSKHEALSSNPSTTKTNKKKNNVQTFGLVEWLKW